MRFSVLWAFRNDDEMLVAQHGLSASSVQLVHCHKPYAMSAGQQVSRSAISKLDSAG